MSSRYSPRSKRIAFLVAGFLACVGLVIVLDPGGRGDGEDGSTRPEADGHAPASGRKARGRASLSAFSERLLALDWSKRKDLFREALRNREVPLEELWATFQELDSLPGEKFGLAALAVDLFSAYAEQDPAAGLANFETLNAGVVRRQALMGFASHIPAEYVFLLVNSVKSKGFPDEELAQIALQLHTAAKRYSASELKRIIDSGYFDETAQQELTWMYEHNLYRVANPTVPSNPPFRTGEPVSEADGSGGEVSSLPEDGGAAKKEVSPAMVAFNSQLSRDRFGAANGLQRGVFDKGIVSRELVKNVSRYLVAEDPARSLTWAGNWVDPKTKETAVESVVWSWARSDSGQCASAIKGIMDQETKDIAAAGVAEYLISHGSFDEASTWIGGISDPARRKRAQKELSKAPK